MLSAISKQIIQSRLYDKGIIINTSDLDNYLIDPNSYTDNKVMYNDIVNNWNRLIIK